MVYNKKYKRWVSKDGLVYRYSKTQDKLVLCKPNKMLTGYYRITVYLNKRVEVLLHRLVWETFNGEIPSGMEIDHIDTNKENNSLNNLRCVTAKENMNNPLTLNKLTRPRSDFGIKYQNHYGYGKSRNINQYARDIRYFIKYGKCRWE